MLAHNAALVIAKAVGPRPRAPKNGEGLTILLTGRFESGNWAMAHLGPLAASRRCERLLVVSTFPVPPIPKVEAIYPSPWMMRALGATASRLLIFMVTAFSRDPHVVGGFHLLVNGLVAGVLGRLIGARSLYFCVGGPAELLDGGVWGENGPFAKAEKPDPTVERRLLRGAGACDLIITMGTKARRFLHCRGIPSRIYVVPGGIDTREFEPAARTADIDLVLVGRLAEIKRIDLFIRVVAAVRKQLPDVRAAIVGDGEQRDVLRGLALELGVGDSIVFAGFQQNVADWLRRSRVFVLTSRSEGLSLALMEAMLCGLPAVVSDVGDLGDLVENGVNGFLMVDRTPEAFAAPIVSLLRDRVSYEAFSDAARRSALRFEPESVCREWDLILDWQEGNGSDADHAPAHGQWDTGLR
jgi:glycosyltransferase involved in cell wall biosynthesis